MHYFQKEIKKTLQLLSIFLDGALNTKKKKKSYRTLD